MNFRQKKHTFLLHWVIGVSICCGGSSLLAQGDFAFPTKPQVQPQAAAFQPPSSTHSAPQPVLTRPEPAWPDQPVRYDDYVKQVNVEQARSNQGVANLIDTTVDSAGEFLGSWKEKIDEKTDQLLSSSNSSAPAGGWMHSIKQKASSPDVRRMLGSLGLVVGGYLALVVVMRKFGGGSARGIPSEVVEVMGHLPYGPKQNLQLVRLGSKLLLLVNGPEGTHPIGEITDPSEVDYLAALCQGKRAARSASAHKPVRQTESGSRPITEEGLSQVLRRLEQATRGGAANFEA